MKFPENTWRMARVASGASTPGTAPACLRFDRYVLDLGRGCLKRGENDVVLRPKSFEVLRLLVENSGRLVSKDEIAAAVWPDVIVTDSSLVQCVKELRRALGKDGARLITTVSRRGYRLEAAAVAAPPPEAAPPIDAALDMRRMGARMDWRRAAVATLIAAVVLTGPLLGSRSGDDATASRPALDPASEAQRLARQPAGNVEAYDLWARGREIEGHMTAKENVEARKMFLRAIAIDPRFAGAYASVANTYSTEVEMGWITTSVEKAISNSLTYGRRAVALDESLPQARRSLARAYVWHRQPERALAEIEQAVLLNPNYADGHAFYALVLAYDGRAREGLGHIEQAMRINPQYPFWYQHVLGVVEFTLGRFGQAAAHLKEALQRNANWQPARHMLIAAYGHLGRIDDAHWEIGETEMGGSAITLAGMRERVPYGNPADLDRLLEGLRKAGVVE